jgi:ActR/RegA family two-component response regulator
MQEPQESEALIAIVDDDPSARRGLQRLVRSVGWKAETFASAQEFLAHARIEPPSCVVLDLQLWSEWARPAEADGRGRVGDSHRVPYRPWQYPGFRAGD